MSPLFWRFSMKNASSTGGGEIKRALENFIIIGVYLIVKAICFIIAVGTSFTGVSRESGDFYCCVLRSGFLFPAGFSAAEFLM